MYDVTSSTFSFGTCFFCLWFLGFWYRLGLWLWWLNVEVFLIGLQCCLRGLLKTDNKIFKTQCWFFHRKDEQSKEYMYCFLDVLHSNDSCLLKVYSMLLGLINRTNINFWITESISEPLNITYCFVGKPCQRQANSRIHQAYSAIIVRSDSLLTMCPNPAVMSVHNEK